MKIEKINDNQIRCFLSREEMESRQLRLRELAYGTEKARALFHELLREAWKRFGFEVENIPVMIEAIPFQDESLALIVTKIETPEELDTRFSSFSPSVKSGSADAEIPASSTLSQLLDTIRRESAGEKKDMPGEDPAGEGRRPSPKKPAGPPSPGPGGKKKAQGSASPGTQLYVFPTLGKAAAAAASAPHFSGSSALYRDPAGSACYLFLTPGEEDPSVFARMLSSLSEFGADAGITPAREQYLREHCEMICAEDALLRLKELWAE